MRYMVVIEKGASTEAEALTLIEEAIQFHLEDMRNGGFQIPQPASKSTFVEVALAA